MFPTLPQIIQQIFAHIHFIPGIVNINYLPVTAEPILMQLISGRRKGAHHGGQANHGCHEEHPWNNRLFHGVTDGWISKNDCKNVISGWHESHKQRGLVGGFEKNIKLRQLTSQTNFGLELPKTLVSLPKALLAVRVFRNWGDWVLDVNY